MMQRPDAQNERISINGKFFTLAGDVKVYPVDSESQSIRTVGLQQRQNNRKLNKLTRGWSEGIGWSRLRRDSGRGINGIRDADADLAHDVATLPHQLQSVADPSVVVRVGAVVSPQAWVMYRSELYLLYHDVNGTGSSGNYGLGAATFQNDDTYNSPGTVLNSGATTLQLEAGDLAVHKGRLFALYAFEGSHPQDYQYDIKYTTDNSTWSDGSGTGWDPAIIRVNSGTAVPAGNGYPFALLLDAPTSTRHDLIVATREEPSTTNGTAEQTRVTFSANGDSSTPTWAWVDAAVLGLPRGKGIWRDPFTAGFPLFPVISTTENVYLVDTANTNMIPLLPPGSVLTGDTDDGFMQVGSDGHLYVSSASGDIYQVAITGLGTYTVTNIGPVTTVPGGGDGLVAARGGPVTAITTSPRFLYVALQGATYSNIVRFSYETYRWTSFYLAGDTNRIYRMALSTRDDGTLRLHIAVDEGGTIGIYQFEEPDQSLVTSGKPRESSGYIEWAEDDLGDPHDASAVMTVKADADGLDSVATIEGGGGTSNDIEIEYGIDGAAWTNVSNLGFFGSDDKELFFGKTDQNTPSASEAGTPIGISAKTLRLRAVLKRDGTATNGPELKELQTEHVNKGADLNGFVIPIDIEATAVDLNIDPEAVRALLKTIKTSVPSVALLFGEESDGTDTTYYVEHIRRGDLTAETLFPDGVGIGATTERTKKVGVETLYLEERIDV